MSPTNTIWRDAPYFFDYITRCQSFLQWGKPDNDFLVYLPVYDMWNEQSGRLLMFDIHHMKDRAPRFIESVNKIINSGYDVDYISDNFIRSLQYKNQSLVTKGGAAYKAIVIPAVHLMPTDILQKLVNLAKQGATVVFLDNYLPMFRTTEIWRSVARLSRRLRRCCLMYQRAKTDLAKAE